MIVDSIAETSVWGGWSLERAAALELAAFYRRVQPRIIVEAGSGYSTVVAGEYARDTGATVISLDHERVYADRTRGLLVSHGLDRHVAVRHAPLVDISTPAGPAPWYSADLPGEIDFALVDGPPGRIGRRGAMYALMPHLNPDGWRVWLDDADREGEQSALDEWRMNLGVSARHLQLPRGIAVITSDPERRTFADTWVITILTGSRPQHLTDTIRAFEDAAPGVLDTAHVIVCHNSRDLRTLEAIQTMPFVDEYVPVGGPGMVPLGDAMGLLASQVARFDRTSTEHYLWLHLEDDWRAATTAPAQWWMGEAHRVLADNPNVGQVRLRHRSEPTHNRNIRTGAPIRWDPIDQHVLISDTAHYTCNPAVMRVTDTNLAWPAAGESEAIDRYAKTGRSVAQLSPGVFHHTGGSKSLEGHPAPGGPGPSRRRRPMATRPPRPQTTPRGIADYDRFYKAGGWLYDLGAETDVMRMIAYLSGWLPGDRIHEIGAGRGDHAGILDRLGYRVTAVELAKTGTAATKERFPNVEAVNADVAEWTPTERGHIFARGMSWFHWELDGINTNGVGVPVETRALVDRALDPRGSFTLQIWSDLSGRRTPNRIHNNTLSDYHRLFDPIFTNVVIYDWSGNRIVPGVSHDRGVIVVARGLSRLALLDEPPS